MAASLSDRVLGALLEADGSPLSGQHIAELCDVTRAAVWKCVETLRKEGYEIESLPARGYRLASGKGSLRPGEVEAALETARMGRALRHLEEVDSTNREASRWAAEGAPDGAVVVADHQDAGRGRLGRQWVGKRGESLLLSIILRPQLPVAEVALITYVAALALARTLGQWLDEEEVEIKWPNDLLVHGRKVAGILLESRIEGASVDSVIVGVGINVGGRGDQMPEGFRANATTLADELKRDAPSRLPSRLEVLCGLLTHFEECFDLFAKGGFAALTSQWNRWFRMEGRPVTVINRGNETSGEVLGMDEHGALLLKTDENETVRIHAGDIAWATTKR